MRYTNLIWDFDGTLYDSYPHTAAVFRDFLRDTRGVNVSAAELEAEFRITMRTAYQRYAITSEELEAFLEREADMTLPPPGVLYPGARALLCAAKEAGCRQFLYSHRNHVAVDCLRREGLDTLFEGFVTSEANLPLKPAPDGVLFILRTWGLNPEDTVMIGDREIDVLSARDAGVDGLLMTADPAAPTVARFTAPDLFEAARLLELT